MKKKILLGFLIAVIAFAIGMFVGYANHNEFQNWYHNLLCPVHHGIGSSKPQLKPDPNCIYTYTTN